MHFRSNAGQAVTPTWAASRDVIQATAGYSTHPVSGGRVNMAKITNARPLIAQHKPALAGVPAYKRITGTTLQKRRARWFYMRPLCVHCTERGLVSLALELDHIIPLHKGGRDDETNLQGLCVECHKGKTAQDLAT